MKCPFCGDLEDKVIDSRLSQDGGAIRRRRECVGCVRRFTTYERVEEALPLVVKKDGRREPFDREKLLAGLRRACVKRPVTSDLLDQIVGETEKRLQESGEKEVPSTAIGALVMERLQAVDDVAYVRFASVYREFHDVTEFMSELSRLLPERKGSKP